MLLAEFMAEDPARQGVLWTNLSRREISRCLGAMAALAGLMHYVLRVADMRLQRQGGPHFLPGHAQLENFPVFCMHVTHRIGKTHSAVAVALTVPRQQAQHVQRPA